MGPRRASGRDGGQASSSQANQRLFFDQVANQQYIANQTTPIISGRSLTPEFLIEHGFGDTLDDLKFQGWIPYLRIHTNVHEEFIRQMYANLRDDENSCDALATKINGRNYIITQDSILAYLMTLNTGDEGDIEAGGACPNHNNWLEIDAEFNTTQARIQLFVEGFDPHKMNSVSSFTVENRLLHHIVTHSIVQRKGSHGIITDFDIGIMACIRQRLKLNLPYLIMTHLFNSSTRQTVRVYPYSMFLTSYFMNFLRIQFNSTDLTRLSIKGSTYCLDTISRLFVRENGAWARQDRGAARPAQVVNVVARDQRRRRRVDIEEEHEGEAESEDEVMADFVPRPEAAHSGHHPHFPPAPQDPYVTQEYVTNAIYGLRTDIYGRITQMENNFNTRFDHLDETSGRMTTRIDEIAEMMRRMGRGGYGGDDQPGPF